MNNLTKSNLFNLIVYGVLDDETYLATKIQGRLFKRKSNLDCGLGNLWTSRSDQTKNGLERSFIKHWVNTI